MSDVDRVADFVLKVVNFGVGSGLTYKEGITAFRCCVFLMEEVDRNVDIDEHFLARKSVEFVRRELGHD